MKSRIVPPFLWELAPYGIVEKVAHRGQLFLECRSPSIRWRSYNLAANATAGVFGLMAGTGVARTAPRRRPKMAYDLKYNDRKPLIQHPTSRGKPNKLDARTEPAAHGIAESRFLQYPEGNAFQ